MIDRSHKTRSAHMQHSIRPSRRVLWVLICHACMLRRLLACNVCDAGSFSTGVGQVAPEACTQCATGTYSALPGAAASSVCTVCSNGSYAALPGSTTCAMCPGNSSAPAGATNSSQCTCNPGFRADDSGNCVACALSENCVDGAPTSCPPQSTPSGDTPGSLVCTCVIGYHAVAPQLRNATYLCTPCEPGLFGVDGGTCEACSAGTYQTGSGVTDPSACTLCGPGTYQSGTGARSETECSLCGAGTFQTGSGVGTAFDCTWCMPGKYQTGEGMTDAQDCTLCGLGTYQPYFNAKAETDCVRCPVGTFGSTEGAMSDGDCTSCPTGTYQAEVGAQSSDECTACGGCPANAHLVSECPAGSSSDAPGCACDVGFEGDGTTCTACPDGTWRRESDTECVPCPPGTWMQADTCVACGLNTYRATSGGTNINDCTPCDEGSKTASTGSDDRLQCICTAPYLGQLTTDGGECDLCPMDTYLDVKASECMNCPNGTVAATGSVGIKQWGTSTYGQYVLYRSATMVTLAIPNDEFDESTLMYFLRAMIGARGDIEVNAIEQD